MQGEGPQSLTQLDRAIVKLTIPGSDPILIDNVTRARSRAMLDPSLVGPGLKALAAFPVLRQTRPIARVVGGLSRAARVCRIGSRCAGDDRRAGRDLDRECAPV